jgi:tetratricopeptide (TPR) repeat protein
MLRLQNRRRQFFENGHLAIELAAHVAAGELIEVKRTLPSLELLARRYDGWQPIWRYAVGEYHRLRGDNRQALSELDAALSGAPMCHELWANAAGAAILALVELGRGDEAIERGVRLLASARQAQIGCMSHVIRVPLAHAHAAAGAYADAALQAQTAVDELQALGATGLRIANAYRAQARIAAATGDQASAVRFAARGVAAFLPGADPRLLARHRWVHDRVDLVPRHLTTSGPVTTRSLVDAVSSGDVRERRQRGLCLLVESSEASSGHLFVIEAEEPRLVASIGRRPLPHAIIELSMARLAELATEDPDIKTSMSDAGSAFGTTDQTSASWLGLDGEIYRPIPLHHYAEDGAFKLVGLAVLVVEPGGAFVYPARMASELSRVVVHTDLT